MKINIVFLSVLFNLNILHAQNMNTTGRPLPHSQSKIILDFKWNSEPIKYPGSGSDMHWWTWGADGDLYFIDNDGQNFGLPWSFGHLLKVSGTPPNHKIVEITQFLDLHLKDGLPHYNVPWADFLKEKGYNRYVGAPVAIGKRLYVSVYDYDFRDKNTDIDLLGLLSVHAGIKCFIYTEDEGKTWHNLEAINDTSYFLGPRFAALQFINFGPGYSDIPIVLGEYAYAISNDENWISGNNLFLVRVPLNSILDRSKWEFFAGFLPNNDNSNPCWTKSENKARAIFSDPGHCGHSSMTFNKVLGRYFLNVCSDTIPHTYGVDPKVVSPIWDQKSELQIYEGPTPWGPWNLVFNERPWGGQNHTGYLPMMPSKWISADGLSGWLVFSGDWRTKENDWYAFMVRNFTMKYSKR